MIIFKNLFLNKIYKINCESIFYYLLCNQNFIRYIEYRIYVILSNIQSIVSKYSF